MNRLSATLITRDEEEDLPRALASLSGLADEIVVVDSGSTDATCEVARALGARVVVRPFTDYGDQKNFAAGQAAHDWIFSLDADEELGPELRESIREWKETDPAAIAYWVRRRASYLGRFIRYSGWYPDRKIRLYRRDRARFVGALHERVEPAGPTGSLSGDLLHYTIRTLEEHRERTERYTTLAAEQMCRDGRRRWIAAMLFDPPWTFLRTYVLRQGFRDGYRGLLISKMAAYYVFLKYRKLGILLRKADQGKEGR